MKKQPINKIKTFFKEVKQETRKVSWPTKKDAMKYTMIVVSGSLIVAAILGSFDYILTALLGRFVF